MKEKDENQKPDQMEVADEITNIENKLIKIKHSQTILQAIDAARSQKAEAKKSYQDFLDQGDEKGMSHSLSSIRENNERFKSLMAQLDLQYQNIQKLMDRINELKTAIKNSNTNFEKTFKQRVEMEKAKQNNNWEKIRKLSEEITQYCSEIRKKYIQPEEDWKKEYANSTELQKEYRSEAAYIAFKKAENKGQ
jgi:hypothetical protein